MAVELKLICYAVAVVLFVVAGFIGVRTAVRDEDRGWMSSIRLVALGLAVAYLPTLVDTWEAALDT